jgi:hypothetical protein
MCEPGGISANAARTNAAAISHSMIRRSCTSPTIVVGGSIVRAMTDGCRLWISGNEGSRQPTLRSLGRYMWPGANILYTSGCVTRGTAAQGGDGPVLVPS